MKSGKLTTVLNSGTHKKIVLRIPPVINSPSKFNFSYLNKGMEWKSEGIKAPCYFTIVCFSSVSLRSLRDEFQEDPHADRTEGRARQGRGGIRKNINH